MDKEYTVKEVTSFTQLMETASSVAMDVVSDYDIIWHDDPMNHQVGIICHLPNNKSTWIKLATNLLHQSTENGADLYIKAINTSQQKDYEKAYLDVIWKVSRAWNAGLSDKFK